MHRDYGYFEEDKLGKPYDLKLLKRLLPYVQPYRFLFLLSIMLVSVITIMDLALPYLTKEAIDRYIVHPMQDDESETIQQERFYESDLQIPGNAKVVSRYPALFEVHGDHARIAYENLKKLKKNDLILLRTGDLHGVTTIALIFLIVIFCYFFFSLGNVLVLEYVGQTIMHDLRNKLFSHLQDMSVTFFAVNPVGRLVTRVTSDVQNMHEFFTSIITVLFKDIFLVIGITVVLLIMNWKLAILCFVMLPVVFFVTVYFSRLARDVYRELRSKIAEINTRLQENIDGIRVVQLFSREKRNYEQFKALNHENYQIGMRQINIFAVFMPSIEVLSSATTALVVWYGGTKVLGEHMSLGVMVAFVGYMRMFFRPIRDIAEKYNIMQSAMASSERIFLLFDTDERIPDPETSSNMTGGILFKEPAIGARENTPHQSKGDPEKGLVAFDNVWFSYHGEDWILKDLSFYRPRGRDLGNCRTDGGR